MTGQPGDLRTLEVLTNRAEILRRLCDGPAYKRDLVDEMEHSRSTIDRAVDDLEAANLVERRDDGIVATVAGRLALERLRSFRGELDDVVAAEAVLDPLSFDAPIETDAVAGGETILATEPAPYRPLERFHGTLADARRYRALLPALDDPRHVRLLYEHVVTGGRPAELVVAPELLQALREEFPRRTAAMAESDGFDVHVGDVPPFALALVDRGDADPATTVAILVFNESGAVHGVLLNETPAAVRWAEDRYAAVRADSDERTDALFPDADGGTRSLDADGGSALAAIGDGLSVALEREGFVRLDVPYFREEPVADPTTAWRAGLTLPEVHTGYAVERTLTGNEAAAADGRGMTAALSEKLAEGQDCVVVGPPGSGKSTVCKRVACEWYDADEGPVLYREGGRGRPFDSVEDLVVTVDAADGHTLVVVEDAVRPETDAVFDAIDRLADRDDVSFLLDAREHEWQDPPGDPRDVSNIDVVTMPPLHEADGERLVERFQRTVGRSVDVPVDRLLAEVRDEGTSADGGGPNEVLLLLHRLATYVDPLADGRTSLEDAVAAVHDEFEGAALDVCVLANVLNAAGVGVERGLLYAAADADEYDLVDDALDRLEGRVLFPRDDGTYRTVHETWSVTFLAHLVDAEGEAAATDRFGRCVSALLSLADDPARRDRIAAHLDGRWSPAALDDDPGRWADETTEAVYALGRERPKLAPLYGDGERDSVALPDACSASVAAQVPRWIGRAFLEGDFYDRAERAFERLPREGTDLAVERLLGLARVAAERGEYDDAVTHAEAVLSRIGDDDRPAVRARAQMARGRARFGLGDTDAAWDRWLAALEIAEAAGDRRRTADLLNNLGVTATILSGPERAGEYYERSLEIKRDLGDRQGAANSLGNLGLVARRAGDYEAAREYCERSLEIKRDLGDRQGQATSLNNLGISAYLQGEYGRAREYLERALGINEELGHRRGVANSRNHLGIVARRQADYDPAREFFERSLAVRRELGNRWGEANALNNLGLVAADRGEYETAREYHERSLEIRRDLGDREGVAMGLRNLGVLAWKRGEFEAAREYYERSLDAAEEAGAADQVAMVQYRLGEVLGELGKFDRAGDYLERAFEHVTDGGDVLDVERIRLARGRLALARGTVDPARERAAAAHETLAEIGADHWEARGRRLLGRIAAEAGSSADAREHWRSALETFEAVGAPQDALATLRHLVETCREAGKEAAAGESCRRAEELLESAPDPVADEHRDWVEECLADLD
ncbi:hypothetical protein BRC81_11820 [Halobacteriales archaeon QS_1_68_20]|nr:MAG: hypothetical protein BRC81_11820 [Halobacteriales archaeon QS_1_68_20]